MAILVILHRKDIVNGRRGSVMKVGSMQYSLNYALAPGPGINTGGTSIDIFDLTPSPTGAASKPSVAATD